ncbi:MaoC domain protein dehydratase [Segniliparus rotundus DSM 44985]|uniref:MaoC domain protein dehydratase n=1 Tax=Segniliparus rotundus (strain ATCC BAA-972 / CDC 1076 / CIP 108378 / DSM 44985 / JCM 13578) TaxID=640132 RepID=D6Z9U4_SEGRD|nr:MaoC/PaaZ C-terminal domain-containing protein [Segniliparus rotundus]ADG98614.1 MaoC domain protein dehydratase [Segniliparus rotundus DSM 44985]
MGKTVTLPKAPTLGPAYLKVISTDLLRKRKVQNSANAALPSGAVAVRGLRIDPGKFANYIRVTGLKLTGEAPSTYAFILSQPLIMTIFADPRFPFQPNGLVHFENVIRQERPVSPDERFNVRAWVDNLREHRKGLLFDATAEISVGNELVWTQKSTLLKQQKTSLSDQPAPEPPQQKLPPVANLLSIGQFQIWDYAAASGDFNPIHISGPTAKLLGFPKAIAHGMWEAAAALRYVEGSVPPSHTYSARFGRPLFLPGTVAVYVGKTQEKTEIALRDRKTGAPHFQGTISRNA